MSSVQQQLDEARKELLDLSLRNTLINYRTLKSRGLDVIDEVPAEVFRILVREGRKMSFLPAPEEETEEKKEPVDDEELFEEMLELLRQPEDEEDGPAARHVDTKLQTPYTSARLQRRLLNTFYKARTFIEERGVNVLYLALGMLEWYEAPQSDTTRHAPLILVPVELTRTSVQARFRLIYSGEDIGDNLSLQAKLKAEFGLQLPELPDVEDLDVPSYFDAVDRAVSGKNRWNADRDAIALGFFSFAKLLMYNDLDVTQWPEEARPDDHPVVRALLADGFDEPEARIEDEGHLDEHLHPEEVHHVMNADASQTLAMLDIKQGLNLVIQGPPGTGKSQTIANVIAEAIGQNKTVLFVSEKMAALEVVKRRLDNIHLGDACLELHSHKTRKKDVLQELERTLRLGRPKAEAHAQDLSVLQSTRSQLNAYCEAVNARIGESGVTPYQAYGHLLRLERRWEEVERPPRLDASDLRTWTAEQYQQREALTRQMESLVRRMGLPTEHPFWGSRRTVFLPSEKQPLVEAAEAAHRATEDVLARSEHLATELGLAVPTTRQEVSILCRAARRAMDAPNLQDVQLATRAWQERRADLETLLTAGERHAELHTTYDDLLIPDAWTQDILQVRQHLAAHGEKWWRFLIGDFRRAKATLAGLCQQPLPKAAEERVAVADAILEAQRLQEMIEEHESLGRDLFGAQWGGLESDWEVLHQITTWMQDLYADIDEGDLPHGLIAFLSGDIDRAALEADVVATEESLANQSDQAQAIATMVELDEERRFGADHALLDQPLTTQATLFEGFAAHVDRLQEMVAFNHRAQRLLEDGCALIVQLAVRWPQAGEHLVAALRYAWHNALVERAMEERPILAQFDGATHDEVVETFRELDRLSLIHNRARLALAHWKSLPKRGVSGQMGHLRHEFQKKRRHWPIRKLIRKAGHAIQAIKPVFMMSPMSIATYLPPGSVEFDLVVFDEASQVKPVDAFGAILRGKQTVVVGDSKQLPPTSFFDSVTTDEDADTTTADLESVLGLFKAQGAPERMLRWHYRSRHESLITV
ncbi:MAG: DUF4011 domain-containing protein, partial [Bacteroidetes bacterium]|nr:DUF4011 domain-containing protein [Bacteroidota bacterium]